jgi:type 1 fimbria pilin
LTFQTALSAPPNTCFRPSPFYTLKVITMKNQTKKFSNTMAVFVLMSLASTSVFAQALGGKGTVSAVTCVLAAYSSATSTTALTDVTLPVVATTTLSSLTAAGPLQSSLYSTSFFVKPTDNTCIGGAATGNFNVRFSSATGADTSAATKAKNGGTAASVTIDLVPVTSAGVIGTPTAPAATGMSMTATTAALQHGLPNVLLASGNLQFQARYYRTNVVAATPVTVGTVITSMTMTTEYF